MTLTHENIHAAETPNGSFNWRQLKLLGVATPPRRGWLRALIGTEIPDATYAELVALRTAMHREKQSPLFPDTVAPIVFPDVAPDDWPEYKLPQPQEKRRESPAKAVCVAMQVPLACVETVQSLIRLHDALTVNRL